MKKMTVVGIVLMASVAAFAAKKAKVAPPPAEGSRAAFELPFKAAFEGKNVGVDEGVGVGGGVGDGEWTFALPVEDDSRLRFVRATMRGGKFEKGTLCYYGLPEQPLTADEFAGLRAKYPMAAACGTAGAAVRLLAPADAKWTKRVPPPMRYNVKLSPLESLYGSLLPALARLGVKASGVAVRVDFTGKDGKTVTLGTVRNARGKADLDEKAILGAIGEATGLVSVRERVDWLLEGTLTYAVVEADKK